MMFYPMFYFDPTYVLILIGVVISMAASAKLNSTYQRYSAVRSMCGMTGADAAKRLLANQGIYDVTVRRVPGNLTDHYDPRSKTVNLSDAVYNSTSIAAIGVAAHDCFDRFEIQTIIAIFFYSIFSQRLYLFPTFAFFII